MLKRSLAFAVTAPGQFSNVTLEEFVFRRPDLGRPAHVAQIQRRPSLLAGELRAQVS
jgi:hypothetical protein